MLLQQECSMFDPTSRILSGQLPRQGNYLAATKQRVLISYNLVLHLFCQKCLGEGNLLSIPSPRCWGRKSILQQDQNWGGSDLDIIVFFSPGEHHSLCLTISVSLQTPFKLFPHKKWFDWRKKFEFGFLIDDMKHVKLLSMCENRPCYYLANKKSIRRAINLKFNGVSP